jgi:hypothetical protein
MTTTHLSHLASTQSASRVIAPLKKSISPFQPVAFSQPARKHSSFQNRAQKPFADTPYLSRKQGFCAHPTIETLEFATILLGKNSTRRKNSRSPIVGLPRQRPSRHVSSSVRNSTADSPINIRPSTLLRHEPFLLISTTNSPARRSPSLITTWPKGQRVRTWNRTPFSARHERTWASALA